MDQYPSLMQYVLPNSILDGGIRPPSSTTLTSPSLAASTPTSSTQPWTASSKSSQLDLVLPTTTWGWWARSTRPGTCQLHTCSLTSRLVSLVWLRRILCHTIWIYTDLAVIYPALNHTNPFPTAIAAPFQVLATDYHSYSCVYSCIAYDNYKAEFGFVYSRTPQTSGPATDKCAAVFSANGVNVSAFRPISHGADCVYWA